MDSAKLILLVCVVITVIDLVISIVKAVKAHKGDSVIAKFMESIPAIDEALKDFLKIYASAKTNDHMEELMVDFLYDVLAKNTTLDEKYPAIINKENIEKYILPVFKKVYATELKK